MKLIHVQFSNVNTRHDSSLAFLFRELSAGLFTDRDERSGFEKETRPLAIAVWPQSTNVTDRRQTDNTLTIPTHGFKP